MHFAYAGSRFSLMESLYLLIPIAFMFAVAVGVLLIWAVNRGQYDDLDNDAWRALNDDLGPDQKEPGGDD